MAVRNKNKLKAALLERRQRLLAQLESALAPHRLPPRERAVDEGDVAAASNVREDRSEYTLREAEELREIDEVLDLLDEGGYGKCQRCGRSISEPRLRAIPTATLCLRCKKKQEAVEASDTTHSSRRWRLTDSTPSSIEDEPRGKTIRGSKASRSLSRFGSGSN